MMWCINCNLMGLLFVQSEIELPLPRKYQSLNFTRWTLSILQLRNSFRACQEISPETYGSGKLTKFKELTMLNSEIELRRPHPNFNSTLASSVL